MSDAYRTPGREVDETEIARAKLHEEAETKRKLIEEKEATKRARVKELGYAPHGFFAAAVVALALIGGIAGHAIVAEKVQEGSPCRESVRERASYNAASCTHPLHVLVQDEKSWTCKCGTPVLK